jgi:kynurenine formamidase
LANTRRFELEELSRYDDRGPAWYWNDIHTGEHTGTHLDAPVHWITGQDGPDVSQAPLSTLVGAAAVIDMTDRVAADPDFLLEVEHVRAWEAEHGALPAGGWLLYRTGWDTRGDDAAAFANADEQGPHTPGVSPECARWLARRHRSPGSGWRRWAPTPARRPGSTRRSRATTP